MYHFAFNSMSFFRSFALLYSHHDLCSRLTLFSWRSMENKSAVGRVQEKNFNEIVDRYSELRSGRAVYQYTKSRERERIFIPFWRRPPWSSSPPPPSRRRNRGDALGTHTCACCFSFRFLFFVSSCFSASLYLYLSVTAATARCAIVARRFNISYYDSVVSRLAAGKNYVLQEPLRV